MKAEVGKMYKHYKTDQLYLVVAIALHTETDEEMVVYQAQYDTADLGHKPVFVRPRAMFEETVFYKDTTVDRFQKIT